MKNIKYEINKISSIRLSEGITFNVLKKVIKTAILVVVICGSLLSYGIIASNLRPPYKYSLPSLPDRNRYLRQPE